MHDDTKEHETHNIEIQGHNTEYRIKRYLARDLNWLQLRPLLFLFRYSNSEHSIFHTSLYLFHSCILGKPEPPHEFPRASLNAVPPIIFLFLLSASLSTNLQHPPFFHLHLHLLLLQPGKVHAEHVSLCSLFPVHASVRYGIAFATEWRCVRWGKGKPSPRIKYIRRQRIVHVASSTTQDVWDERHGGLLDSEHHTLFVLWRRNWGTFI